MDFLFIKTMRTAHYGARQRVLYPIPPQASSEDFEYRRLRGSRLRALPLRIGSPITLLNEKCPPTICLYGTTGEVKTSKTFTRGKNGKPKPYTVFWKLAGSKEPPPESVGMDGIVAVQNYVTLTNGLTKAGVPFAARLEPYRHCRILSSKPETRPWLYENLGKYLNGNEAKR